MLLDAEENVLTVCKVLSDPSRYHGQIISVRGVWINGPEQNYLTEPDCRLSAVVRAHFDTAGIYLTLDQTKTERLRSTGKVESKHCGPCDPTSHQAVRG